MLLFPDCILHLEERNQWVNAIEFLLQEWRNDKQSLNKLLCAAMETWYVMLYYDQLMAYCDQFICTDDTISKLFNQLNELTTFGFRNFSDDFLFNLFFGYMIFHVPYHFCIPVGEKSENSYDFVRQFGYSMCEKAFCLQPKSVIAKLFLLSKEFDDAFSQAAREGKDEINRLFPEGKSAVIDYFRGNLS